MYDLTLTIDAKYLDHVLESPTAEFFLDHEVKRGSDGSLQIKGKPGEISDGLQPVLEDESDLDAQEWACAVMDALDAAPEESP